MVCSVLLLNWWRTVAVFPRQNHGCTMLCPILFFAALRFVNDQDQNGTLVEQLCLCMVCVSVILFELKFVFLWFLC